MDIREWLDWKAWACFAFLLAAIVASFTAFNYRHEAITEKQTREQKEARVTALSESLKSTEDKLKWSESRLAEKEQLLKASQKGSREEVTAADGSKSVRETWENTTEQLTKQLEISRLDLEDERAEKEGLRTILRVSQASEMELAEKVRVLETKTSSFRAWGILAGRSSAGLGYHVNLGLLDLGAYYINASYTEFAPSWAINARF